MSQNPSANTTATTKPTFELLDNGDVVQNRKGKPQLLAKYDEATGLWINMTKA